MSKKNTLLCALVLLLRFSSQAQSWGDYTLIAVQGKTTASLIDLAQKEYKAWTLTGSTGYSSYLLPGGTLLRTVKAASTSFQGGGICGRVQKTGWDSKVTWDYTVSSANECSHHDICAMPNGNVLIVLYERKTAAEATAAGVSSSKEMWSEVIREVQPDGLNGGIIVWEWKLWDHLVQASNSAKANFGVITEHPERLDVNYRSSGGKDWVHANGIDYNAKLDQIVFSSHALNELYVIDHSTTKAEAATHSGGKQGKGGDFLYRWGNPAAYGATGTEIFKVVHDAHWIPEGCPNAGWLVGFNNQGISSSKSAVTSFNPDYTFTAGQAFSPATYGNQIACSGYSSNMGSSQQLPNGNVLISVATAGLVYEVNSAGTTVWSYKAIGTTPQAFRYSAAYVMGTATEDLSNTAEFTVYPNPSDGIFFLRGNALDNTNFSLNVFDFQGRTIRQATNVTSIELSDIANGLYFLEIKTNKNVHFLRKIVLEK